MARGRRAEIILSKVNPISIAGQAEIRIIINDQHGPVLSDTAKLACNAKYPLWWRDFVPVLDDCRAGCDQFVSEGNDA